MTFFDCVSKSDLTILNWDFLQAFKVNTISLLSAQFTHLIWSRCLSQSLSSVHITGEDTATSLSWIACVRACVCELGQTSIFSNLPAARAEMSVFHVQRWRVRVHACVQSAELILSVICHTSRALRGRWRHRVERRVSRLRRSALNFSTVGVNLSRRLRRWRERFRWGRRLGGGSDGGGEEEGQRLRSLPYHLHSTCSATELETHNLSEKYVKRVGI